MLQILRERKGLDLHLEARFLEITLDELCDVAMWRSSRVAERYGARLAGQFLDCGGSGLGLVLADLDADVLLESRRPRRDDPARQRHRAAIDRVDDGGSVDRLV